MKKINRFLIPIILTALLINPVFGYPGMGGNNSGTIGNNTQNAQENIGLANATQSDQDIELSSHLIEVDAAQFESQNRIYVRETLLYKNIGAKNFSGTVRTWVPAGVERLNVGKVAMTTGGSVIPINAIHEGNVVSWQDYIRSNDPLPPLYAVEYTIPSEAQGTLVKSRLFSKKLVSPTLINKAPKSFILKVTRGSGENIVIKDEKGSSISSSGQPQVEGNSVLYRWDTPEFKEINIELSKSSIDLSQIGLYLIIGLLIILVIAYPVIRKKSTKLQEIEEKIRSSISRKSEEGDEEAKEENDGTQEEEISEEKEEEEAAPDQDLSGKTKDELGMQKDELLSKLDELEKDYASGNLIDEEYEELKNSYQQKLKKINRQIELS